MFPATYNLPQPVHSLLLGRSLLGCSLSRSGHWLGQCGPNLVRPWLVWRQSCGGGALLHRGRDDSLYHLDWFTAGFHLDYRVRADHTAGEKQRATTKSLKDWSINLVCPFTQTRISSYEFLEHRSHVLTSWCPGWPAEYLTHSGYSVHVRWVRSREGGTISP